MGAEVYFWWMVVIQSTGSTVVPVPYQTQQMCEWAGENTGGNRGVDYTCIPQPAADVAEFSATWVPPADICQVRP